MTDLDNDFGMRCPKCGASDEIDVAATVWVRLCPDGTDIFSAADGDHEWNDHSGAICQSCGHDGNVSDFQTTRPLIDQLKAIAKRHLLIDTLDARNRDGLDFHDVSVRGVRDALEAAYKTGFKAGQKASQS